MRAPCEKRLLTALDLTPLGEGTLGAAGAVQDVAGEQS